VAPRKKDEIKYVQVVTREGEILGPWVSSESRPKPGNHKNKAITHINYRDKHGEIQTTPVGVWVNIIKVDENSTYQGENWWKGEG
jgi:hypothetical protein